jgi:Helicase associated domain
MAPTTRTIAEASTKTVTQQSLLKSSCNNQRKGSNASSISSSRSIVSNTIPGTNADAATAAISSNTTSNSICESRLPRKKRKESHEDFVNKESGDLSQTQQTKEDGELRKNSYDVSTSSFSDLGLRKGSMGTDSMEALITIRKTSHDANSLSCNSLLPLPSLDDAELFSTPSNITGQMMLGSNLNLETTDPIFAARSTDNGSGNLNDQTNQQAQMPVVDVATGDISANAIASFPETNLCAFHLTTNSLDGGILPIPPMSKEAGADDNSSQDETFASSGHRILMEAIMMSNGSGGCGSGSSKTPADHTPSIPAGKNVSHRERFDSNAGSLRDAATAAARIDRYSSLIGRRDRLESWGGMSDLSVPATSDSIFATAVAAATNLHNGLLFEDPELEHDPLPVLAMSASVGLSYSNDDQIPTKVSLPQYRDRFNSIASLGDLSVSNFNNNGPLIVDGIDVPGSDLQAFVAAAMASVGDQLIELAGAMEELTGESLTSEDFRPDLNDEADSSVASPMIGAVSDIAASGKRPRAWSTSSRISVDLDAVQAAVDAAYSFTMSHTQENPPAVKSNDSNNRARASRRALPLKRARNEGSAVMTPTTTSEERTNDKDAKGSSKKRSRRGEVSSSKVTKKSVAKTLPPLKKRPLENREKRHSTGTPASTSDFAAMRTPKLSNRSMIEPVLSELRIAPSAVLSSSLDDNDDDKQQGGGAGQANQKWEKMFSCMLEFAQERQAEETKDMTPTEKSEWVWDGNVPTNYKSKDGMALGRWVNNQRSAKAKGNLKDDREQRLIDAGLKWSVVASNSWNEMLEELSIYIKEQHRQGKVWDGNVPTNYQIKSRPNGGFNGEDKNLGRWVNRQRSLYQSGKLRKDRKSLLEGVGLKWSMLATTSWDGMYDTLKEYAEQQMKKCGDSKWDGNVPATYRTNDNPPRALGRWVNRQRSSFAKKKLKKEFVDKLNSLGLKWSIHHRQGEHDDNDDGEFGDIGDEDQNDGMDECVSGDSSGKENTGSEKDTPLACEPLRHAV